MAAPALQTVQIKIPLLVIIDTALAVYYKECGRDDYFSKDGKGKFREFMEANDLNEDAIQCQLADDIKNIEDCLFLEMDQDFPLRVDMKDKQQRNEEIFKILHHCYKYQVAPSADAYDKDDEKYDDYTSDEDEDDDEDEDYTSSDEDELAGIVQEACNVGPDVSKNAVRQTGSNSYHYYYVKPGLNYGGMCFNQNCKAHNQPIIYHRGFGEDIYPLMEQKRKKYGCPDPKCNTFFELDSLLLYKCDAKVEWQKENEKELTKKPFSVGGNKYVEFGEKENGVFVKEQVKFEVLVFTVTPRKD